MTFQAWKISSLISTNLRDFAGSVCTLLLKPNHCRH